mmetsp:Transcript_6502/g.28603  ORF Transcript_6502/g.28603 Transcript_6502/m.28603 type:complete len:234 (-) Transcript_6502:833-1534(-)
MLSAIFCASARLSCRVAFASFASLASRSFRSFSSFASRAFRSVSSADLRASSSSACFANCTSRFTANFSGSAVRVQSMNARVSCLLPSTVWWKLSAISHILSDLAFSVSARQSKKWCFLLSNARLTWLAMALRNRCSTPSGLNVCQSWFALPTRRYGRPVPFIALSTCSTRASRSFLYRLRLASNVRSDPSWADQSGGAPGAPHPRWLPTHQCITSTTTTTGRFFASRPWCPS